MHFSIPDTQEFLDKAGNAYIVSIDDVLLFIVHCVLNFYIISLDNIIFLTGV